MLSICDENIVGLKYFNNKNDCIYSCVFDKNKNNIGYVYYSSHNTNETSLNCDCDVLLSICFDNNKSNIKVNLYIDNDKYEIGTINDDRELFFNKNGFLMLDKCNSKINLEFIVENNIPPPVYKLKWMALQKNLRRKITKKKYISLY